MRTLLFKVVRILSFTSRVTRWERSAAYDWSLPHTNSPAQGGHVVSLF
jgi:hypothetical protein